MLEQDEVTMCIIINNLQHNVNIMAHDKTLRG